MGNPSADPGSLIANLLLALLTVTVVVRRRGPPTSPTSNDVTLLPAWRLERTAWTDSLAGPVVKFETPGSHRDVGSASLQGEAAMAVIVNNVEILPEEQERIRQQHGLALPPGRFWYDRLSGACGAARARPRWESPVQAWTSADRSPRTPR